MMQSQRYPESFGGIVAGSHVFDWVGSQFAAPWVPVKGMRDPERFVPRTKLPLLNAAVKNACDGSDGVIDGLLEQPQRCDFDPSVITCAPGTDNNSCLTEGQVASFQRYFAPVTRPNGEQIYAAFPHGSEVASSWLTSTTPVGNWAYFWPSLVFENPAYSIIVSLNVDTDGVSNIAKTKLTAHYDAVAPGLSVFKVRGSKIMVWHGTTTQQCWRTTRRTMSMLSLIDSESPRPRNSCAHSSHQAWAIAAVEKGLALTS